MYIHLAHKIRQNGCIDIEGIKTGNLYREVATQNGLTVHENSTQISMSIYTMDLIAATHSLLCAEV